MFAFCNLKVKEAAEVYRKNQLKTQLFRLWYDKTGTKNPRDWSNRYRTPILCCVSEAEFEKAKKVFDPLNRNDGTDAEIDTALAYLESTMLFDTLQMMRSETRLSDMTLSANTVFSFPILIRSGTCSIVFLSILMIGVTVRT